MMLKIKLFCSAGMSTSMLVTKMQAAAAERGLEVEIEAYPESTLQNHVDDCDVALLGPQVRFLLEQSKAICEPKGVPIAVIAMQDYGMMNGKKVLDDALELINN